VTPTPGTLLGWVGVQRARAPGGRKVEQHRHGAPGRGRRTLSAAPAEADELREVLLRQHRVQITAILADNEGAVAEASAKLVGRSSCPSGSS
jgi:hypothetical protein